MGVGRGNGHRGRGWQAEWASWGGDQRGHLEVELGRFCGYQGAFQQEEELVIRPGLQEGEGKGLEEEFVLDFGVCAVAGGQVLGCK